MLPDASRMISTEQFVDADHVEAAVREQFVMGVRDVERRTAIRMAATGVVDMPTRKNPAAEPAELSQLDRLAGEWTVQVTNKPSVWTPDGGTNALTERNVWVLGGRYLMNRTTDEQGQLTAIWLATYEPAEQSNHFWFFHSNGSTGQWRVTWDDAAKQFDWRAVDLPDAWTGTGSVRQVDADTFHSVGLIKDGEGRVLMDSTQDKRRKK
jgi:hypothetical protein